MKNNDGLIEYEVNDCVQGVRGQEVGVIGVVIKISGSALTCWGRVPSQNGGSPYEFQVDASDVMYIGSGKIRKRFPNELPRSVDGPRQIQNTTSDVVVSARARRQFNIGQQQQTPAPPLRPPSPENQAEMEPSTSASQSIHGLQFGGMDSEELAKSLRPKPVQDPIDPALLKPAVFVRPSAVELHKPVTKQEPSNDSTNNPAPRRGGVVYTKKTKADKVQGQGGTDGHQRPGPVQVLVAGTENGAGQQEAEGLVPPTKDAQVREPIVGEGVGGAEGQ